MSKRTSVSERLRAAILTAGESRYRIAKQTGVAQAMLSRFVHRKTSMNLTAVDALARHLQLDLLRIVADEPTKRKGR
ncbi:MAG: helix-turn-helix transcriptional regulator [Planctomycetota bacterium]|nr:helix-turn-helix transcriptional regulator [Planctomycetota bacterium]